jgi:uncharacterized protein
MLYEEKGVMKKPHIDYPCNWSYKIIGTDEQSLKEAALSVVKGKPHSIEKSNTSSGGKYISVQVSVMVVDETERLNIFDELKKREAIRVVI